MLGHLLVAFRLVVLLRMTRLARISSQCKGDALLFSYILIFPSAPSGTLTMLRLASSFILFSVYRFFLHF